MLKSTIDWLLEEDNPAVKYRTATEILTQSADVSQAKVWLFNKLPADWYNTNGLWYTYYVNAIAESGLSKYDIPEEHLERAFDGIDHFQYGCADFMLLRAVVMIGFHEHVYGSF